MAAVIRNIQDYKNFTASNRYSEANPWGLHGSNPANILNRIGGVLLGTRAIDQLNFGNELEPARQAAIKRLIAMSQPGGEAGLLSMYGHGALANSTMMAKRNAMQARDEGDATAYESYLGGADNVAQREINNYASELLGYGGMMNREMGLLQALGIGQDPSLLGALEQSASNMEGIDSSRAARSNKGILGGLGGIINAGAQLFGAGVFGGGGAAAPSGAARSASPPSSYYGAGGYTIPVQYGVR